MCGLQPNISTTEYYFGILIKVLTNSKSIIQNFMSNANDKYRVVQKKGD